MVQEREGGLLGTEVQQIGIVDLPTVAFVPFKNFSTLSACLFIFDSLTILPTFFSILLELFVDLDPMQQYQTSHGNGAIYINNIHSCFIS